VRHISWYLAPTYRESGKEMGVRHPAVKVSAAYRHAPPEPNRPYASAFSPKNVATGLPLKFATST